MLKQDCPCSFEKTREIRILGAPVRVKNYLCARDGEPYRIRPEDVRLQLSIVLSRYCDAHCPFCIAAPTDDPAEVDAERLREALRRLKEEEALRGVKITGGEPGLRVPLLDTVIHMIFEIFGMGLEVSVDTNGTLLPHLRELRDLYHLEAIHISRHHWDDGVNDRIFGRSMPSAETLCRTLRDIGCPDLFVLNCLMLRGAVSTPEELHRYLDFAAETGAGKVAFITASPVNAWTESRRVKFDEVLREEDPAMLLTRGYRDYTWCHCQDGVYVSPTGRLIEFYGRQTEESGCDYCRGLVYGPDNMLRDGFNGRAIWPEIQPPARKGGAS